MIGIVWLFYSNDNRCKLCRETLHSTVGISGYHHASRIFDVLCCLNRVRIYSFTYKLSFDPNKGHIRVELNHPFEPEKQAVKTKIKPDLKSFHIISRKLAWFDPNSNNVLLVSSINIIKGLTGLLINFLREPE